VDLRLSKTFRIEHWSLRSFEVLGEAFNLLNHQNVTSVYTNAYCVTTSPSLTAASTAAGCPQVQTLPTATSSEYLVGNPLFGTNNNSNSNITYSSRQLQIAGRLYF
jgi:hypothetical protein